MPSTQTAAPRRPRAGRPARAPQRPPQRRRTRRASRALVLAAFASAAAAQPAAAAKPLTVKAKLSTRVASATIGEKGGTLTVRTPSGARVKLTIPARSLAQDTPVKMTAVSRLSGLPFKRQLAAAVTLEPEGVTLLRGAKLTITPRRALKRSRRAAVAWRAGGRDAHLYPTARGRQITLALSHFSGYGTGEASAPERRSLAAHTPADPVARTENAIAKAISDHPDLSSREFDEALAEAVLPEYGRVAALLRLAETDDTFGASAIQSAIMLERTVMLLGTSGARVFAFKPPETSNKTVAAKLKRLAATMQRSVPRVFKNAYESAKRRCVVDHQPGQADRILNIDRERSLLDLGGDFNIATRDYYRCARYTLEFTSSFTDAFSLRRSDCEARLDGTQAVAVEGSAVSAQPPNAFLQRPEGTSTVAAQSASYSVPGQAQCTTGSIWSDPSTYTIMNVSPGTLSFQPDVLWDAPTGVLVLTAQVRSVALRPGAPWVQMMADWGGGLFTTVSDAFFADAWRVAHGIEAAHDPHGRLWYMLGHWAPGSGEIVGTLTLDRDLPYTETDQIAHMTGSYLLAAGTLHEQTTLTLRHTPDPSLATT